MFSCGIDDVQDNYRIVVFEGLESLSSGAQPLKSHLTDGPFRPSGFSVCLGDVIDDYEDQEIDNFMEELGVYVGEIGLSP
jgi:hypothetical protein